MPSLIAKILENLYKYDWVKSLKEYIRPLKHFVCGKGDIYFVVEQIQKARGTQSPVFTVFDVGAADGDKTITFLKNFPQATVYCFEPLEESLERLNRRTRKWQKRVKIFPVALGAENGFADFHVVAHRDSSSFLFPPKAKFETRKVSVRRLDDIVREENIKSIDLVKIDVEGAEKLVLEGAKEVFKNKVNNVFIEISAYRHGIHSAAHIETFQYMYDCGFTFINKYGDYFFSKDEDFLKHHFGEWYR